MKKQFLLLAAVCFTSFSSLAQFTFVDISDMHVSNIPFQNSDTNAQYFQCYIEEFANLTPKPAFVIVSGDISNVGNQTPDGIYPLVTQYLYPPSQTNPGIGQYFIDSAKTIPVYFTPGNHEYWEELVSPPPSSDTLTYYKKFLTPDTDYTITTSLAVLVFLRSGSDVYGSPTNVEGNGLTLAQCAYLRSMLSANSSKRKIIVMHHPAVNAVGTNSDGTPFTGPISDPADNSIVNNRTTFLNICDSNQVDIVLNGHEHQNVVANRNGYVINENCLDSNTRYIQTAAAFNRSYRIITVNPTVINVSAPLLSCNAFAGINEISNSLNISVYPNPVNDKLTIECSDKAMIEISNIQGQIMKMINSADKKTTIDLFSLSTGIYIIKVKTDNGIAVKKFIKQ
jgi:predicted MPP superfamily phosphohydrolase